MKLVDIARAVNEKLKPLNIPIVSDDIRSGFERPAFFGMTGMLLICGESPKKA